MGIILLTKAELRLKSIIRSLIKEAHTNQAPKPLLTDEETAKVLKISKGTLPVWRCNGKGPRYVKVGSHVRYRIQDIDEYLKNNTVVTDK
jgi:excisionase family DNA binding protein